MTSYVKYEIRRPKDGKLLGFLNATDPLDARTRPYIGFQTTTPVAAWDKGNYTQTVRLERMDVGARVPFGAPLTIPTLWLIEGKQTWLTRIRAFTRR